MRRDRIARLLRELADEFDTADEKTDRSERHHRDPIRPPGVSDDLARAKAKGILRRHSFIEAKR